MVSGIAVLILIVKVIITIPLLGLSIPKHLFWLWVDGLLQSELSCSSLDLVVSFFLYLI